MKELFGFPKKVWVLLLSARSCRGLGLGLRVLQFGIWGLALLPQIGYGRICSARRWPLEEPETFQIGFCDFKGFLELF